ncbi:MAG: VWA domain-containing protein [Gemmatimonadota bacterium]|nr:VWA domain-containing protein [Gemmatimonadota bacterium]
MSASASASLVAAITRFCRELRARELLVTPAETVDALRALEKVDVGDREEVYLALRVVLASRVEDHAIFDELFDTLAAAAVEPSQTRGTLLPDAPVPLPAVTSLPGQRRGGLRPPSLEQWLRQATSADEPVSVPRASDLEAVGGRDVTGLASEELHEIERIAAQIARRLAARPSRRWRSARRGPRIHLRATMRQSLKTGGDTPDPPRRERKPRRTRVVAICDVSGSMDIYSRFLLQFLYALQNGFARVETFVFSTKLSRVTRNLTGESYRAALGRLSGAVQDWSGGTRIGSSLATFNANWSRLVDRRTVVVIVSDGWDTGDPDQLGTELRAISRRAGRVIWLNPLLGSPLYEPLTRGMQAALPHVDVFAPAHNLASLRDLPRHLRI